MLGIEAELIGLAGPQIVTLQDLSATGAKLQLRRDGPITKGFLRWMQFEVFGDIAWREGMWCGLRFDRPISNACLVETRAAAPGLIKDAKLDPLRHAEEFVKGLR